MPQFVLLLRDTGFPADMSPAEIQSVIERYGQWMAKVKATGEKLRDGEGRVIQRNGKGTTVTDGPYAESKEVMGGFFIVEASSYDEAVRMCNDCPHLDFGTIEVRQVDPTSA